MPRVMRARANSHGAVVVPGPGRWETIPLFARPILRGCWDEDPELPPRLLPEDLQHPEHFHQRLAAWLMKQH